MHSKKGIKSKPKGKCEGAAWEGEHQQGEHQQGEHQLLSSCRVLSAKEHPGIISWPRIKGNVSPPEGQNPNNP